MDKKGFHTSKKGFSTGEAIAGIVAGALLLFGIATNSTTTTTTTTTEPKITTPVTETPKTTPKTTQTPEPRETKNCNIKGNISYNTGEKIYHVLGQRYYESTVINTEKGERWFCSEAEAVAAGWRKSKV